MNNNKSFFKKNEGQLLVELLISLMVGGIFLVTATVAIMAYVRYNFEARTSQSSALHASGVLNLLEPLAESNWHALYDLTKGTSTTYYIISSVTSSVAVQGEESLLLDDVGSSLIGHWKFDEATGTVAYDSSLNGNGGVISAGTRLASTSCSVGTCLGFSTSSVTMSSMQSATSSQGTVSFWMYLTTNNLAQGLFHLYQVATQDYMRSYINASNVLDYTIEDDDSVKVAVTYDLDNLGITYTGRWIHIVWVQNGSAVKLYINGEEKSLSGTNSGSWWSGHLTGSLTGKWGHAWDYLQGRLDDGRLYKRALSADEVLQLYESKVSSRYFTIENVYRNDSSGNISTTSSGSTLDPSTQKITVKVTSQDGKVITDERYLTRSSSKIYSQSDWSGGYGISGPVTSTPSGFSTSSDVLYITAGSITINGTSTTASLESTTFDTQVSGGAAINSIIWQGTQPSGTDVRVRLAYSSSSSGPWSFVGSDGTGSTYFDANPNAPVSVTNIHNYRYFRYKIYLTSDGGGNVPTVDEININWSP